MSRGEILARYEAPLVSDRDSGQRDESWENHKAGLSCFQRVRCQPDREPLAVINDRLRYQPRPAVLLPREPR
jgi:hypothetical protein